MGELCHLPSSGQGFSLPFTHADPAWAGETGPRPCPTIARALPPDGWLPLSVLISLCFEVQVLLVKFGPQAPGLASGGGREWCISLRSWVCKAPRLQLGSGGLGTCSNQEKSKSVSLMAQSREIKKGMQHEGR